MSIRIQVSIETDGKACKCKGFIVRRTIMWTQKHLVEYVCPDCHGNKTQYENQTVDEVEFKRMLNIKD